MRNYQAVIIGGGSAGLSAAVTLKKNGIEEGKNLIITYDVNGSLDSQRVEEIITDVFDL